MHAKYLTLLGLFCSQLVSYADWPQFRGPDGDGHSSAKGLPVTWSEQQNVKWKTPVHGKAWSSPVWSGDRVWVSTATEDGRELSVVSLDLATGKIMLDEKLFDVAAPQFCHKFNSYASPTPAIDGDRIYVTFGSPGTACLDLKTGKKLWERRDLECNHYRGAGSSPIVYQGLLIMPFDGSDHQYIVALDKLTGKTVWLTPRSVDYRDLTPEGKPQSEGDWRKAFATPHVAVLNGVTTLLSSGAKAHYGYDPLTGKEYWRVEERGQHSAGTRPVVGDGLVFFPTGFAKGQILAVKPPAKVVAGKPLVYDNQNPDPKAAGDLTVVWKMTKAVPNKPSLLLLNDLIYMVNDGGVASCVEAKTGNDVWSERVGGNFSAAPLYADGHIYFCNEEGKTTVIEAGREYKVLAQNQLDDGFMASPAVAGKALILRTKTSVYRIEQTP